MQIIAAVQDTETLKALSQLHLSCLNRNWSEEDISSLLKRKEIACFITKNDGLPVGFIVLQCVVEEGEIINIGVVQEKRKNGIGSALLAHAIAHCKVLGAKTLWLEVAENNPSAIQLYKKHGFTESGKRKGYYKTPGSTVDALKLKLEIA